MLSAFLASERETPSEISELLGFKGAGTKSSASFSACMMQHAKNHANFSSCKLKTKNFHTLVSV